MLSFGDFKKSELTELTKNKDPLGLNSDMNINNSDIESNTTIKINTETPSEEAISPDKTNTEYDAIPHYLKAVNFQQQC